MGQTKKKKTTASIFKRMQSPLVGVEVTYKSVRGWRGEEIKFNPEFSFRFCLCFFEPTMQHSYSSHGEHFFENTFFVLERNVDRKSTEGYGVVH